jgi:hypothetical protein
VAVSLKPLVIPPRPAELPTAPPPAEAAAKPVKGPHLRNDAFLARWIEDFERVVKDVWLALQQVLGGIDLRLIALETRVSDTYTWGQRGSLTDNEPMALPLRVVRPETIVEFTIAAEKPAAGAITIEFRINDALFQALTLPSSAPFVAIPLPTPRAVLKDDKLSLFVTNPGAAEDVVVQARCV